VARALVAGPALLLADEPTGNLDEASAADLQQLLRDMHREQGLTSIVVTHNAAIAAGCDRVLRLEGGHLVPVLGR
jgi:lipoprotein-releasing system ATP-binding protein